MNFVIYRLLISFFLVNSICDLFDYPQLVDNFFARPHKTFFPFSFPLRHSAIRVV